MHTETTLAPDEVSGPSRRDWRLAALLMVPLPIVAVAYPGGIHCQFIVACV